VNEWAGTSYIHDFIISRGVDENASSFGGENITSERSSDFKNEAKVASLSLSNGPFSAFGVVKH